MYGTDHDNNDNNNRTEFQNNQQTDNFSYFYLIRAYIWSIWTFQSGSPKNSKKKYEITCPTEPQI